MQLNTIRNTIGTVTSFIIVSAMCEATADPDMLAAKIARHSILNLERETVTQELEALIDGYVRKFDRFADYIPAKQYRKLKQQRKYDAYRGFGIDVVSVGDRIVLVPSNESPFADLGFSEPILLQKLENRTISGADKVLVGDKFANAGTRSLRVTISRIGETVSRGLSVASRTIVPHPVEVIMGTPAYLRITEFRKGATASAVRKIIEGGEFDLDPLVIDLRNASGGDLFEAIDTASVFLEPGRVIAYLEDKTGKRTLYRSINKSPPTKTVSVMLVSSATASAAEVFVKALRHHGTGIIAGQFTFGKCDSQTFVEFPGGGALRLTNLKILDPQERYCDHTGIVPDVVAAGVEIYNTSRLLARSFAARNKSATIRYICVSRPFSDRSRLIEFRQEIEVAMDVGDMTFQELPAANGKSTSRLLCLGPLAPDADAQAEIARFSDGLGASFIIRENPQAPD